MPLYVSRLDHPGLRFDPCNPAWYQLAARSLSCLLQPSLTEAALGFKRTKGLATSDEKRFALIDMALINPDTYIFCLVLAGLGT